MHQYLRSTCHNSSVKPPFKIFSYERQKPVLSILAASWLLGSQLPQTWRHNSSKTVEQPLPLGFRGTASAKPWPLRSAKWFYLPKPQRWFLKSLTNDTSSYPEHLNYLQAQLQREAPGAPGAGSCIPQRSSCWHPRGKEPWNGHTHRGTLFPPAVRNCFTSV